MIVSKLKPVYLSDPKGHDYVLCTIVPDSVDKDFMDSCGKYNIPWLYIPENEIYPLDELDSKALDSGMPVVVASIKAEDAAQLVEAARGGKVVVIHRQQQQDVAK